MKCKLCDETSEDGRFDALASGWRLVEVYGPQGNKYLAACPSHTPDSILQVVKELLSAVSKQKGKK